MNRREFLKMTAAVTGVTAATGPIILGDNKNTDTKTPVIGVDGHKYECHHGWGTLPGDLEWQTTHNVAIDSAGLVYITHQGQKGMKGLDTIMVFDHAGKFVRSFGKDWHGGGHGIEVRKDGNEEFLYLTNTWTPTIKVAKTTLKGELVWQKGRPETKEYESRPDPKDASKSIAPAYNPTNVAFTSDGGFFVGDGYGSNYMMKYDKNGELVKTFGGGGKGQGKFATPHGQWVDERDPANPVLIVCDRANARLQTFSLDGEFISMTEKDTVLFPAHIDIRGEVMMVPDLHARISLFNKNNQVICHLGDDSTWRKKVLDGFKVRGQPKEWVAGKFIHPHDACFDKDGNIYVAEWVQGGRVSFLKKVG